MIKIRTDHKTRRAMMKMERVEGDVRKGIEEGFQNLGSNLVRIGQTQALEIKHGREYRVRSVKGGTQRHRASAPGESPALLSGNYHDEFKFEARAQEMEFGNDAEYSEYLEFGVRKGKSKFSNWRMEPRPGVKNAVNTGVRNSRTILETNIGQKLEL